MKMPENMTWARQVAVFCIFVTTFIAGFAFLLGHSVEAVISRFFSIEMVLSIFLVSISFLIYAPLRHQLLWLLVSVVPSLIWQPVGIPLILVPAFDPFDPFAKFSWIPALITLAMTILFWLLEKLEEKYFDIDGLKSDDEIRSLGLDVNPKQNFRE